MDAETEFGGKKLCFGGRTQSSRDKFDYQAINRPLTTYSSAGLSVDMMLSSTFNFQDFIYFLRIEK